MKTKKELLEKVAQLINFAYPYEWSEEKDCIILKIPDFEYEVQYDPFEDNGDAFELMVTLKLNVQFGTVNKFMVSSLGSKGTIAEMLQEDPCAAIRHSIVVAAVSMADKQSVINVPELWTPS